MMIVSPAEHSYTTAETSGGYARHHRPMTQRRLRLVVMVWKVCFTQEVDTIPFRGKQLPPCKVRLKFPIKADGVQTQGVHWHPCSICRRKVGLSRTTLLV